MDGATVIPFPNSKTPPLPPEEPELTGLEISESAVAQCENLLARLKAGELQAFSYAAIGPTGLPVTGWSLFDRRHEAPMFTAASLLTKDLLDLIGADHEDEPDATS